MTIIIAVESTYYRIPLAQVLTDAMHGEMSHFELNVVRIMDDQGQEGLGYTYTAGANGQAIEATIKHEFIEGLKGQETDRIEAIWHQLWWHTHYGGRGGAAVLALSAVDIALWDLKAKHANLPLWRLLGGFNPEVPCYAGGIDLQMPLDELLAKTETNLKKGFAAIKMKVGRDRLSEDKARVKAMRELLGERPLMADANMRWSADEAIRAARAFQPYDLTWLEEPSIPEDVAGYARIVAEGGVPIATGENFRSVWEFRNLIMQGGVTFPEPDVTNCGGITAFMKVVHLAEAFNLKVTSHGAHDITVQLLAACPNRSFLEVHGFGLNEYITKGQLKIANGMAIAGEAAGHGIDFDWQALNKLNNA